MLNQLFKLDEMGTTVQREVLAGATTFLTMAYIIVVNPGIISETGMDFGAVFVATCVAAAFGSLVMGFYANYPIALAPGMGLNAYFTYAVVLGMGLTWQVALGAVFISGILFLILSVLPVREWIVNAIPRTLKMAISAGIGFFLGVIALTNAGIVVNSDATLVTLGNVTQPEPLLAALGFVIMIALDRRGVPGAVLLGILIIALIGILLGYSEFKGIVDLPPNPAPTFLQMDLAGRAAGRHHHDRVRLPVRRLLRFQRHAGRPRPPRRAADTRRQAGEAEPRPGRGLQRHHRGLGDGHLDHHQLHRKRGRH